MGCCACLHPGCLARMRLANRSFVHSRLIYPLAVFKLETFHCLAIIKILVPDLFARTYSPKKKVRPQPLPTPYERDTGVPFVHSNKWHPSLILQYGWRPGIDLLIFSGECTVSKKNMVEPCRYVELPEGYTEVFYQLNKSVVACLFPCWPCPRPYHRRIARAEELLINYHDLTRHLRLF